MEVKQDQMTDEKWEEMRQLARDYLCAECDGELTVHTIPERGAIVVGCLNPVHHGFVERTTYTQALRRGEDIHPAIRDKIERKLMPKEDLSRAMNLLALRYPLAIIDPPTAALFIIDCARLELDPLISPAEAVPIPFKGKGGKVSVQMIITGDGWLSMAARGCPDEWVGPPRLERITDVEEIKALCGDEKAWCYAAYGYTSKNLALPLESLPRAYGYFTQAEYKRALGFKLPAAENPGNQAIWRATKKWVRANFPQCRQNMIALSEEWRKRAAGIKEALSYVDAEYHDLEEPKGEEGRAARAMGEGKGKRSAVRTSRTNAQPPPAAERPPDGAAEVKPEEQAEGEGFNIDLTWLNEALKVIKWTEETAKSWLATKFKVDNRGQLSEVISRLTREQAEEFVKEIQDRATQKQPGLFE